MAEAKSEQAKLPEVWDACFNMPLYRVIAQGDEAKAFAEKLAEEKFKGDAYCVDCKRETPFKRWEWPNVGGGATGSRGVVRGKEPASLHQQKTALCARCGKNYHFYFAAYRNGIAKVGQNPSPADIARQDMLRFRAELDDLDMGELEHATRMFSLGIGVGAFVYLRRIFERLLDRHHATFVAANGPIEGYEDKMRWEERVLALATILPKEVVENRKVYAILSVGIHELQEAECLLYYPVLRAAIIDILEQDIAANQRCGGRHRR
jgi:hypothetical protein